MKKKTIKQTDYRCSCCKGIKIGSNVKWVYWDKSKAVVGICKGCFFQMQKIGKILDNPTTPSARYVSKFLQFMHALEELGISPKKFIGFIEHRF